MRAVKKNSAWIWLGSRAALLLVGVIWGSSLVVVKSSINLISPGLLVAGRFTLAFILLSIIFFRKFRLLNRQYIINGALIGVCLFAAQWIQSVGVTFAMPGKSAFLSSIYCVLVPFVFWMIGGGKPSRRNIVAVVLCAAGIVLSSIQKDFFVSVGDALALLSGVFFAAHIAVISRCANDKDPVLITILQFGFCAVFGWFFVFLIDGTSLRWHTGATGGMLYLALVCTAFALLLQNVGQKYADPASASILMSTEAVFGVIFSVIFMQEIFTAKLIFGFLLIFISVIISELRLDFKDFIRRRRKAESH